MGNPAPNLPFLRGQSDYGDDEAAMVKYRAEGTAKALALPNRGPVSYDKDGNVDQAILDAYSEYGFYVFTGIAGEVERAEIEADVADILDRAPTEPGAALDKHGNPAIGSEMKGRNVGWTRPLADPAGGTSAGNGRYPGKMIEPVAPEGAPEHIVQIVLGSLQYSDACLRLYGHPDVLNVVSAINGEDFTPFNEAVWIKHPGLGGSVAWHQDGTTHWDNEDLDEGTHGFNCMMQLYGCNATNAVWVVPGSHRLGKVDIKGMMDKQGSDRLADAVPVICEPGDMAICNRQAVHGSFANTGGDVRVTINFGFHRRKSVLNVTGGGIHNDVTTYDANYIKQRSRVIGLAIDARHQRFPEETAFVYKPFVGHEDEYRWTAESKAGMKDYNVQDLGI